MPSSFFDDSICIICCGKLFTPRELVGVYGTYSAVEADLNGGSSLEMLGFFSGLIQCATKFNTKRGGGSVTLILLSTRHNKTQEDGDTIWL